MSCPSELTWSVYVDGELPADEVRQVESHLIRCQECRGRVLALRDEATLLGQALQERGVVTRPLSRATAPDPGVAIGFPLSVAAVTLVLAVVGALVERGLPGGFGFLNPMRLLGVYEVIFDLFYLLRNEAPGLFEFLLSLAALGSFAAIASFAVNALYRRFSGAASLGFGLALLLVLTAPEAGRALDLRLDQDTRIGPEEVIPDTLVLTGDDIDVDGVVEGDLVVGAERLTIRGTVQGNLFAGVRTVDVQGVVEGGAYVGAEQIRIDGEVRGNLIHGSEEVTLVSGGRVGRSVVSFAESASLDGSVGRNVVFGGEELEVRGEIGGNVDVRHAERVALLDGARVAGDVDAVLDGSDEIDLAPGATVGGEIRVEPFSGKRRYLANYLEPHFYLIHAVQLVGMFLFGLLLYALIPGLYENELPSGRAFLRSLGWGFVLVVATPVALVLTALTVVGIPIAIFGLFVYVTGLFVSMILVGGMVGRALVAPEPGLGSFGGALLLGLGIVFVAAHIPFIGPPVGVVVILLGLGLLAERAVGLRAERAA